MDQLPNAATPFAALIQKGFLVSRLDAGDKMPTELPDAIRVGMIFDHKGDGPSGYDWAVLWSKCEVLAISSPNQRSLLCATMHIERMVAECGKRCALVVTTDAALSQWILTTLDFPNITRNRIVLAFDAIPPGAQRAINEVKILTKGDVTLN